MSINKINPATLYDGAPFGMSQAAADAENKATGDALGLIMQTTIQQYLGTIGGKAAA